MSPESDRRTTQCHEIIRKAGETDEHDLAHFTAANAKELIIVPCAAAITTIAVVVVCGGGGDVDLVVVVTVALSGCI